MLVQDSKLKGNTLYLLHHVCNSGPERHVDSNEAEQSSVLCLAVGKRQQQKLLLPAVGRIWPCTCRSCRCSEQLRGSAQAPLRMWILPKRRLCLKFGSLFVCYFITWIAAIISNRDLGQTVVDTVQTVWETASAREILSECNFHI